MAAERSGVEAHDGTVTSAEAKLCFALPNRVAGAFMQDRVQELRESARQCRLLAETSLTADGGEVLAELARDYDARADRMLDSAAPVRRLFGQPAL